MIKHSIRGALRFRWGRGVTPRSDIGRKGLHRFQPINATLSSTHPGATLVDEVCALRGLSAKVCAMNSCHEGHGMGHGCLPLLPRAPLLPTSPPKAQLKSYARGSKGSAQIVMCTPGTMCRPLCMGGVQVRVFTPRSVHTVGQMNACLHISVHPGRAFSTRHATVVGLAHDARTFSVHSACHGTFSTRHV